MSFVALVGVRDASEEVRLVTNSFWPITSNSDVGIHVSTLVYRWCYHERHSCGVWIIVDVDVDFDFDDALIDNWLN